MTKTFKILLPKKNSFLNRKLKFINPGSGIRGLFDPGLGIRDQGSGMDKNQDPGSEINIPAPQHCIYP
jgi:hypothetical protein